MSDTVVTIHYQSPADDPFKVPRPTRIRLSAEGNVTTTGGEGEIRGDELVGFSRQDGPPESFDTENWVEAEEILFGGVTDLDLSGWFAAFMSRDGIYTWSHAIARVEVEVQ